MSKKRGGRKKIQPYSVYYPHTKVAERWEDPWYQVVSIDPATKNFALRIERRYHTGEIITLVFSKVDVSGIAVVKGQTIIKNYDKLTTFLDSFAEYYPHCHYIIIEQQLKQNIKATRISQHTLSYFLLKLYNLPLLPYIIELSSTVKGKILGYTKGLDLKAWAVIKARELLTLRGDTLGLRILDDNKKQDDLADTVCQIEALFILWNLPPTLPPGYDESQQVQLVIS